MTTKYVEFQANEKKYGIRPKSKRQSANGERRLIKFLLYLGDLFLFQV